MHGRSSSFPEDFFWGPGDHTYTKYLPCAFAHAYRQWTVCNLHLSSVCTAQIYTGSLVAMFSPSKCILSHLPQHSDFQKVLEFLGVVPEHTRYFACLRNVTSRGTLAWLNNFLSRSGSLRAQLQALQGVKDFKSRAISKKSLQNHGQSLAMMSAYRNVFVIFYRWLQKGGFQFNEGFWLCSADGQSCICGFRWWPTEWLSQGLICSTHEPCTFTVYILSLFHTVRLTVGFLFCDWSFTGGWCVAILILNVLRDKFNYHYE